jgi:CRISPR-associated endonuclease/helicase Cas3
VLTLHLAGQSEKLAPANPRYPGRLLYHQVRTAEALREETTHLVLNSYNTGTGKTHAALLHLLAIDDCGHDVLLIAPTNALLGQHADDARRFVAERGLRFEVIPVTANTIARHRARIVARGDYSDKQMRPGEVLFRLIRNYREFNPGKVDRQGLLFVVNPDIFYYALMFQYGSHDQRNLFQAFLTSFSYIIIDEFHYYNQKQLAFFLFFFAISRQMGYFEYAGRKVCLLSATPNVPVLRYLDQLFGDRWRHVSPTNEPQESDAYDRVSTLTPLMLRIGNQELLEWGRANNRSLRGWLLDDQCDGAIISDSLRRINQLYADLLPILGETTMGRITGPEPEDARQSAAARPLILATPTVDIGYNFDKRGKSRQNIDFLICEARYGDDLIQRIGRAGRVLGKAEQDQPAEAVALLRQAAFDALRPHDGRALSRAEFSAIVAERADVLPHKHDLTGYIRTWAITEVFYPLYRAHGLLVFEEERRLLEALYEQLRELFGVRRGSFGALSSYFKKFYARQRWLEETEKGIPYTIETASHVADWLEFRGDGRCDPADIEPYLTDDNVLRYPEQKAELRSFVQSQVCLTQSLFNFRDSFQSPTVVCHDPNHLLSSENVNTHELLHIVGAYHVQWFDDRAAFVKLCGKTELSGDFYGRLVQHRDPLLSLELHYDYHDTQEDFARMWEGAPVALNGFKLLARERGGDVTPIDERIGQALADTFLTVLLLPPDVIGWAYARLRDSPVFGYKLTIDFRNRQDVEYLAYVGQAAWFAYPELQVAFKIRARMKPEAIIL